MFPRRRFLVSPRAFSCEVFPRRRFYFLNDATGDRRLRDSARNCPILIGASEPRTTDDDRRQTPHKNDLKIPGQLVLSRVRVSRTKLRSQGDQNIKSKIVLDGFKIAPSLVSPVCINYFVHTLYVHRGVYVWYVQKTSFCLLKYLIRATFNRANPGPRETSLRLLDWACYSLIQLQKTRRRLTRLA